MFLKREKTYHFRDSPNETWTKREFAFYDGRGQSSMPFIDSSGSSWCHCKEYEEALIKLKETPKSIMHKSELTKADLQNIIEKMEALDEVRGEYRCLHDAFAHYIAEGTEDTYVITADDVCLHSIKLGGITDEVQD